MIKSDKAALPKLPLRDSGTAPPAQTQVLRYLYGADVGAVEVRRTDLLRGDKIAGPAVIRDDTSTTFVPTDRTAKVGAYGEVYIS